jgi:predicted kinase
MMITTPTSDLEREALRLETDADTIEREARRSVTTTTQKAHALIRVVELRSKAAECRQRADLLRRQRTDGVRFG